MIAFEVSLNGRKVCIAGVGDLGVLSTIVSWVRREERNTETGDPEKTEEELTLNVSGLISSKREHVRWAENELKVGDEVCVRIVDLEFVDAPRHRKANDPEEDSKHQQRYVEQMAKQFGWTIQK